MLFNSLLYLFFFAATYIVYWSLSNRWRPYFLILASLAFYASWGLEKEGWIGLRWTVQFLAVLSLNYLFMKLMFRFPARKKALLGAVVILDLINLFTFKYTVFFLNFLFNLGVKIPENLIGLNLFLPLAISFYTFQMIAYMVDVYRGVITREVGAVKFFLFFVFFPPLVAGPIMRSTDFMDQIESPLLDKRRMYDGIWLILGGVIKKVMMADAIGFIMAPVFRQPETFSGWSILLAGMAFSIQVYSDFSGYTDMARGSALLLGFKIPENFKAPFFSTSARELWQRWHITLSTWLRDYIYISMGGSRSGEWRTYLNLVVTFTLGGLWHGADYTYMAWGVMWGFLLAVERFFERRLGWKLTPGKSRPLIAIKVLVMFVLFSIGALMFRSYAVVYDGKSYSSAHIMGELLSGIVLNSDGTTAANFAQAGGDVSQMVSLFGDDIFSMNQMGYIDTLIAMFIGLLFFHFVQYREGLFEKWRKYDPYLLLILTTLVGGYLLPIAVTGAHQFIYSVF